MGVKEKKEANRFAYGAALREMGKRYPQLIVMDADVAQSTRSIEFGSAFPERFFNMGIAEANMVSMAAGLATMGYIPVVNTFSFLLCERALDQIRSGVAYNHLPVKFAAHYGGLSDSYDGASHHSVTDLGIIGSIPGMTMIVISDAAQMRSALPAILEYDGPVYFRLCRAEMPLIHAEGEPFIPGKGVLLADGNDLTLVVTGVLLSRVLRARELLAQEGIRARVVEIHTIKPLDRDLIVECARETGAMVVCEEGNVLGGLGAAVSQTLSRIEPIPIDFVGMDDCYAESGGYDELLDRYGMSVDCLIQKARLVCRRKKIFQKNEK